MIIVSFGDLTQLQKISSVNKFLKTPRLEVRDLGGGWFFVFFLIAEQILKILL